MQRLQSKVAIVTASTRGIGFEIARRLCSEGASVVISSRKPDSVKAAVDILRKQGLAGIVEGTSCHVGNADDRQKLLDFTLSKFGRYRISARNTPFVGNHFSKTHQLFTGLTYWSATPRPIHISGRSTRQRQKHGPRLWTQT